jgi:DNA polymerase-3 subunit gamma/tau
MNFSRRLRPKIFEEIVGQDLVKSMLKNSIFLDKIFPVYLFAGQRGCGKTSTARIFAKSLNCSNLEIFRSNPKINNVPCLTCISCVNMDKLSHPDFFEIDAASNNGVDNIRQVIETTFYQPLMGMRRVFLIDEAHMLSKAAFNALLKILEEPPKTVVFLLATTEIEKIPVTIRSRAFLSMFPNLPEDILFDFLAKVCVQEGLSFEPEALSLIVGQSQGCPRDALNLLEQICFCSESINLKIVQDVFNYSPASEILAITKMVFVGNASAVASWFLINKNKYSAIMLFESLQAFWVNLFNKKIGVIDSKAAIFLGNSNAIEDILLGIEPSFIQKCMRKFWDNQRAFSQINNKASFLEFLLIDICFEKTSVITSFEKVSNQNQAKVLPKVFEKEVQPENNESVISSGQNSWQSFLNHPEIIKQKMLISTLCLAYDLLEYTEKAELLISLPKVNNFIINLLNDQKDLIFTILPIFFKNIKKIIIRQPEVAKDGMPGSVSGKKKELFPNQNRGNEDLFDFSDIDRWPKVNLVLQYFPGSIISEIKKR